MVAITLSIIILVLKCWLFLEDARLMDMDQSFELIYFHQHPPFIFNLPSIKSSHIIIFNIGDTTHNFKKGLNG